MSILPDSGRGDVFALPDRMPGKLRHVRHSCTVFGGLAGAGEVGADTLQAMANLVPCGYPALTTGNARLQYLAAPTTGAAHGLTLHRGKVVLAQGTGLFVSSGAGACTRLGNVTDTDKRFASFGDLLFILPDGLVYNAADGSLRKFGLDTGNMENVSIDNVYLTVPTAGLQTKGFRVGDCIRLDIQGDIKSAVLNGYYRISALTESYLCVEGGFPERGTFTARVRRVMPDLEGLCAMGDRLYGFAGQSVYACEAGNPWNWYWADAASPETAPFSLHTAGGSDFTACTVWQGYPIFFRADGISRLMGRAHVAGGFLAATGVTLSEQSAPGIPAGQAATLCGLDGALYYCSGSDVYRYAGAAPARVCDGLPAGLRGICAGTDGRGLYLSATESNGTRRLFLYCPGLGWYRLDPVSVTAALFCPDGTGAGLPVPDPFIRHRGDVRLHGCDRADTGGDGGIRGRNGALAGRRATACRASPCMRADRQQSEAICPVRRGKQLAVARQCGGERAGGADPHSRSAPSLPLVPFPAELFRLRRSGQTGRRVPRVGDVVGY